MTAQGTRTSSAGTESGDAEAAVPARRRPSRADSLRPTYGFDDVSLAPGADTVEPADVDVSVEVAGLRLEIPVLAAAWDPRCHGLVPWSLTCAATSSRLDR